MSSDTIYALASGAGRAAIAVIRLSGPAAGGALQALAGKSPAPRLATFAQFRDPEIGALLDAGLALWFPAPASPTGEDYAELHIHGGRAVIDAMLGALGRRPGLRAADPGEFTRRGFINGKLDLSQTEALADLIDAETEAQRRQAVRIAGGALRRKIETWRTALIDALALVESELDFSDEADVSGGFDEALRQRLSLIIADIRGLLREAPASERLREGFTVLLLGPPNAGKSTLMNALVRRDVAIVSDRPGTTRDMIEVHLDLSGLPVTVVDTAGIREASDEIERIGIDRTLRRAGEADLLLWLSEGGRDPAPGGDGLGDAEMLPVATKSDIVPPPPGMLALSAQTGAGLDALFALLAERAKGRLGDGSSALLIRQRHRLAVEGAAAHIERALLGGALELVAEELRLAARSLARVTGAVDVEDVLEAIFSRFCIGK